MSVKKFFWMFAVGACLSLCSAGTASACANDQLSHDGHEHVARASKSVTHRHAAPAADLKSEPEVSRPAARTADAKSPAPTKSVKATPAPTAAALQDDGGFDEEAGGACIHGCSCSGRKSHIRGCGTNGDCHAHEGLVCTWASGGYSN
jgi:hypothetical protein